MTGLKQLSDDQLEAEVARLAAGERAGVALLIAHLAELYARRLHERAGFASLFTYCLEVLHFSEHEAYDRMKAAKVARRYPQVIGWLASGELSLTAVRLLAPHLTRANHADLFAAALGKRKRQVQELLAARFPKPDVTPSIRKLPAAVAARGTAASSLPPASFPAEMIMQPASEPLMRPGPPPPLLRPLSPDRYQFVFTAGPEARELFDLARDLLRHTVRDGSPERVITHALRTLVQELVKQKFAMTSRPRAPQTGAEGSRHIPAEVKRAVYIRDRGRCTYVSPNGRKCDERAFLEFDHHPVPFAEGGRATVDNLVLRCRTHNQYLATQIRAGRVRDDAFRSGTNVRRASIAGNHTGTAIRSVDSGP